MRGLPSKFQAVAERQQFYVNALELYAREQRFLSVHDYIAFSEGHFGIREENQASSTGCARWRFLGRARCLDVRFARVACHTGSGAQNRRLEAEGVAGRLEAGRGHCGGGPRPPWGCWECTGRRLGLIVGCFRLISTCVYLVRVWEIARD